MVHSEKIKNIEKRTPNLVERLKGMQETGRRIKLPSNLNPEWLVLYLLVISLMQGFQTVAHKVHVCLFHAAV